MAKNLSDWKRAVAWITLVGAMVLLIPIALEAIGTSTGLQLSASPADPGEPSNVVRLEQTATFTATVRTSTKPAVLVGVGSVDFVIDGTTVATVALNKSGQAMFTTNHLSLGTHTIKANYSGFTGGGFTLSASSNSMTVRHEPKPH
jgi:hypothetical protein